MFVRTLSRLRRGLTRRKRERDAVDAIARAGGFRSVREDMAEMRIARRAADLGAAHEPRAILVLTHGARRGRCPETGPAGAGLEFGIRRESRRAAAHAFERAVALFAVERMREGRLGAVLAGDAVLLGREQLSPLLVGLADFSGAARMHGPASRCGESRHGGSIIQSGAGARQYGSDQSAVNCIVAGILQ